MNDTHFNITILALNESSPTNLTEHIKEIPGQWEVIGTNDWDCVAMEDL